MRLNSRTKEVFDVNVLDNGAVESFLKTCADIYGGNPFWIDDANHIKTVNFAKTICGEAARLATLDISVKADGSARAEWLQKQLDDMCGNLRHWTEYAAGFGTIILKPNGEDVDIVTPDRFRPTETKGSKITGAVFYDSAYDGEKDKWYTRLEYHRFVGDKYVITNKCFIGNHKNDDGKPIDISATPWSELAEEVTAQNVERPLFGVFRMPNANNIDVQSPYALPIYAEAIEELRDLDVAYSRNVLEIEQSKRTVLLDSDRLMASGGRISTQNGAALLKSKGLPDFVKTIEGTGNGDIYHEINPSLNTQTRVTGIDNLLSQIGFKCGFSNGYFVFNQKTGMVTATQVEADDRRTIQLVKDIRDQLQNCVEDVVYALNKFADAYKLAPNGKCNIAYDFGDVTYNREEDRIRWWGYVATGQVPAWRYFVKFEGMTEDEAKAMIEEAQPKELLDLLEAQ